MKSKDFAQILTHVAGLTDDNQVRKGVNELARLSIEAGATSSCRYAEARDRRRQLRAGRAYHHCWCRS